jgi:hypothetical protein
MFRYCPSQPAFIRHGDKPICQWDYWLEKMFEMSTAGLDVTQRKGESGPAHHLSNQRHSFFCLAQLTCSS